MAVYKEEQTNTWRVVYRFVDWTGEKKQTQKRGFKTRREAVAWEHEQLNKANAKIIGVVLNGVPRNDSGYYYYNSYYYRNGRRKKKKRSTSIWTKLGFKKINFKKTGKRK